MMNETDFSSLSRPIHPMPDFVEAALVERGLLSAYRSRPPYQQNDYMGWINRAKRFETKQKRLHQMLDELERGDVYMKMDYIPIPGADAAQSCVGLSRVFFISGLHTRHELNEESFSVT